MHGFQISQLSTWKKLPGLEKKKKKKNEVFFSFLIICEL